MLIPMLDNDSVATQYISDIINTSPELLLLVITYSAWKLWATACTTSRSHWNEKTVEGP